MENMSIAEPVKILLSRISCSEPFSSGIETIATFLKNTEEQWDPVNVIQSFFCKDVPLKLQEYILFCFLEITRADSKTLYHSISYKRLNQLLYRRQSTLFPCSEKECQILVELKKKDRHRYFGYTNDRIQNQQKLGRSTNELSRYRRQGTNAIILSAEI